MVKTGESANIPTSKHEARTMRPGLKGEENAEEDEALDIEPPAPQRLLAPRPRRAIPALVAPLTSP